jgi:hypothetical protein
VQSVCRTVANNSQPPRQNIKQNRLRQSLSGERLFLTMHYFC